MVDPMDARPRPSRNLFLRIAALMAAVALLAAACGGDDDDAGAGAGAGEASSLEALYAEIDGLDDDARRERLLELAAEEDADLSLYTIVNLDDTAVYTAAFTDATGIEVEVFRGRGGELLQRVLEENEADRVGFDVLIVSSPEMIVFDAEGILGPLDSPYTDEVVPSTVNDNWAGVYLNVFLAAWNTDVLGGNEPTTWEDVLTGFPDAVALEAGDFDWFATLVQDYFVAELGYTEEEAVDLFRQAASGSRVIDGHTTLVELLGAGEFDVAASAYHHGVEQYRNEGSPVDWQPAVEPLVMRSTGISIRADVENPATALLFVDFMLSADGQNALASVYRTPANLSVDGSLDPSLEVLEIDVEKLNETRDKWEPLYEEIIRGS